MQADVRAVDPDNKECHAMLLLVRIASIRPRHLETIDTVADAVPSIRVECQIDTPSGSVLGARRDVLLRQPARCEHVPEFFKLVWVVSVRECMLDAVRRID